MGKYGFNENELRKTTTVMVDKDGFHKEVVTYGKPEPAHIATGTATSVNAVDDSKIDVTLVTINVPEDAAVVYFKAFDSDVEYEFEVGDEILSSDLLTYTEAGTKVSDIGVAIGVDSAVTDETTIYYQVYAVDNINVVLDRAKVELDLSGTGK